MKPGVYSGFIISGGAILQECERMPLVNLWRLRVKAS